MKTLRSMVGPVVWLRQMLGWQGLTIAAITLVSFWFGIGMLIREYQRPHQTRRDVLHSVLSTWLRAPDYLGLNLIDYCARELRNPSDENREHVRISLEQLGEELDQHDTRFPLIAVLGLSLLRSDARGTRTIAEWKPRYSVGIPESAEREEIRITSASSREEMRLRVRYQVSTPVDSVFVSTERFDDLLLQALIGLSGCSLLCFGYMVLYVSELRERVARESAQEATIDLADRTCHELGNVAFVVANERRNLAHHIELLDRFLDEERDAREAAAAKARLDPTELARFESALRREYEKRGIAPEFELRQSNDIAREVCRQIAVCSDYITLTVNELDGYLKQSLTHERLAVKLAPVEVGRLFDEAVALLAPRIEAADGTIERIDGEDVTILADRRLVVHVLVNLIKNALEAVAPTGRLPRIVLKAAEVDGKVELTVEDNGPGLDEKNSARIFEDGFSTKGVGRGRGLAIVRESVVVQGGSIEVSSEVGRGTVFRIKLPRVSGVSPSKGVAHESS